MIATVSFSDLLAPIFSAVGIVLAAVIVAMARKYAAKLGIDLTLNQEAVIEHVAKQATALVEAQAVAAVTSISGDTKLAKATDFMVTELGTLGIKLTPDKIQGAIEKVLADKAVAELPPAK